MGVGRYVKNTVKNNTNIRKWSAWDAIADNARVIASLAKGLKGPDLSAAPAVTQTFDEMAEQYGFTEDKLRVRMKLHFRVAFFCLLLALVALVWVVVLLFKLMFLSSIVALSVAMLMFSYAFREHFYYFQIKQRRLNCTMKEWFFSFFSNQKE